MDKIGAENYTQLYNLSIIMKTIKLKFTPVVSICHSLYITHNYWPLSTAKFLSPWGKIHHMAIRVVIRKGSFWIWNNVSAAHLSSLVHPRYQICLFHRRKGQVDREPQCRSIRFPEAGRMVFSLMQCQNASRNPLSSGFLSLVMVCEVQCT